MNLGKLLGAGKSIIGGGKPAAYRTDKRFYLPQFVSPKNPFANPATAAAQTDLAKPAVQNPTEPARKITSSPWAKMQKISAMLPVAPPPGPARATTWASKFNPVSIFRDVLPSANKTPTAVQVELSLEKVKVVHNDLTDAEVEVVPMKSRPAREPAADAPPAKKSWADLGERILKATAL